MRNTYHLCLSSHDEVLFRDEEDIIRGFNCIALAAIKTESRFLADAEMATHFHLAAQSDNPDELMRRIRYPYTRYFNSKYHRTGKLAEDTAFITPLQGLQRTLTAISYICRQGLHHGLSTTPFGYPYCSANAFFRKELGKGSPSFWHVSRPRGLSLPAHKKIPDNLRCQENGMLVREDVIDTGYVEELYVTPRNFMFHMNRFSNEAWMKEQLEELPGLPAINLEVMEPHPADFDIKTLLINEKGRVDPSKLSDLDLCSIIDKEMVPRYSGRPEATIYDMSESIRRKIADEVWHRFRTSGGVSISQIKRCLIL